MTSPRFAVVFCLPLWLGIPGAAGAGKPAFDPSKAEDGGLGMPCAYDKFLALDAALSGQPVDWSSVYRATAVSLDPDLFQDTRVLVPMALGLRVADGMMAIKAQNAELLNKCALDIERLARKMGVNEAVLKRAKGVRTLANRGDWLRVFLDLGFLQQDIMQKIEDRRDPTRGTLVIVSAWMEGARFTTAQVRQNFTSEITGILREPTLVKPLLEKVEGLPEEVKATPAVARLRKVLPEMLGLVDFPAGGTLDLEKVGRLESLANRAVDAILGK